MEPLKEVELPEINYMERLQKELASCCMPSIKDLSKATTDEVTRDIFRVLTGNGNIMGGLVVKIATANTNIQNVQDHMTAVIKAVNSQINRCNTIQHKAANVALADRVKSDMIRNAVSFVWEHKGLIGGAILAIGMIANFAVTRYTASEERAATEQLVKQLDAKVTSIVRAQINSGVSTTPRTP